MIDPQRRAQTTDIGQQHLVEMVEALSRKVLELEARLVEKDCAAIAKAAGRERAFVGLDQAAGMAKVTRKTMQGYVVRHRLGSLVGGRWRVYLDLLEPFLQGRAS